MLCVLITPKFCLVLLFCRITKNCLLFDPIIPEDIDELQITGINYLGNVLLFQLAKEQATVVLTQCYEVQGMALEVVLRDSGEIFVLDKGTGKLVS